MGVTKKDVQAMLKNLPDDCTVEDIQYQLYVMERSRRGSPPLRREKAFLTKKPENA